MEENAEERVERYYKKAMELLRQQKYHKSIHYCQYCLNLIKRKPDNVSEYCKYNMLYRISGKFGVTLIWQFLCKMRINNIGGY